MCSRWNEARLKTIRLSLRVSTFIGICKALPWWFRNAVRTEQRLDAIWAEPSQLTDEETEAQPGGPRRGSHLSRSATRKVRSAASGTSFVLCSSPFSACVGRGGIERGPVVRTKSLPPTTPFLRWALCDPVATSCPLPVSQVTWVPFLF